MLSRLKCQSKTCLLIQRIGLLKFSVIRLDHFCQSLDLKIKLGQGFNKYLVKDRHGLNKHKIYIQKEIQEK